MYRQLHLLFTCALLLASITVYAQPDCVSLLSPVNNATDQNLTITFEWMPAATGEAPTSYDFYAGDNPASLTLLDFNTTSTSSTVSSFFELGTTYYWEVVANSAGGSSSGCTQFTFETKSIPQAPGVTCGANDTPISYSEDMEIATGFTGDLGSSLAWSVTTGKTPSGGGGSTGPAMASSGSGYFFFESSGSDGSTPDASLISPAFDLSLASGAIDFTFELFAHGTGIHALEVGVGESPTGPFTNIWLWDGALQSAQTDAWQTVGFDLAAYAGHTVYIEFKHVATATGGFLGDLALDLLTIDACEPGLVENDDCINAIALNDGGNPGSLSDQNTSASTTSGLTDPSCGPTATKDIFYTIESDIDGGGIDVTLTPGASSRFTAVLYSGTCGSLTELACEAAALDGEVINLNHFATGLVDKYGNVNKSAAETFILRVFDTNNADENFGLAVSGSGVAALPVTLTDWKATLQERSVLLDWTTEMEYNSDKFVIEKSLEGTKWFTIQEVAATGYSVETIDYSYEDFDLGSKQLYRMRMVDLDNTETISSIISIIRDDLDINIYPNPATSYLSIGLKIENKSDITIQVYSMTGQLMIDNKSLHIVDGMIDISNLPEGLYSIFVENSNGTHRSSFVKN